MAPGTAVGGERAERTFLRSWATWQVSLRSVVRRGCPRILPFGRVGREIASLIFSSGDRRRQIIPTGRCMPTNRFVDILGRRPVYHRVVSMRFDFRSVIRKAYI